MKLGTPMRKIISGILLGVGVTLLIVLPAQKTQTEEVIEFYKLQLHECHMAYQDALRKYYENW